jgi:hypothetical protein
VLAVASAAQMAIVAKALDPDGRLVELTDERCAHIVGGHPELAPHLLRSWVRSVRPGVASRVAVTARSGSTLRALAQAGF